MDFSVYKWLYLCRNCSICVFLFYFSLFQDLRNCGASARRLSVERQGTTSAPPRPSATLSTSRRAMAKTLSSGAVPREYMHYIGSCLLLEIFPGPSFSKITETPIRRKDCLSLFPSSTY